jgi:hypothetical protein
MASKKKSTKKLKKGKKVQHTKSLTVALIGRESAGTTPLSWCKIGGRVGRSCRRRNQMAKKKPAKKLTKSKKLEAAKPLFSGPSGTGKTMG